MAPNGWKMLDMPPRFNALWREANPDVDPPRAYQRGGLTALLGREPFDHERTDIRWHMSLRYGDPGHDGRVPTWEELVSAAHELRPGVVFVVGVPPRSWWMNVHPNVLHLHETNDTLLVNQYRANAIGMEVT